MPAQIPPPAEGPGQGTGGEIVLELRGDGTLALNRRPVRAAVLAARLQAIYDGRPRKVLYLKADEGRRYQDVISAMDIARGAGIEVSTWMPRPHR